MYTVYIIKSQQKNWHYVGLTQNIDSRLTYHNKGYERTTKPYRPFKLIYVKEFNDRTLARDYEKFLKIRSNKEKVIKSL